MASAFVTIKQYIIPFHVINGVIIKWKTTLKFFVNRAIFHRISLAFALLVRLIFARNKSKIIKSARTWNAFEHRSNTLHIVAVHFSFTPNTYSVSLTPFHAVIHIMGFLANGKTLCYFSTNRAYLYLVCWLIMTTMLNPVPNYPDRLYFIWSFSVTSEMPFCCSNFDNNCCSLIVYIKYQIL